MQFKKRTLERGRQLKQAKVQTAETEDWTERGMEDGVSLMVDDARWTLGRSVGGKHVLAEMMDGM